MTTDEKLDLILAKMDTLETKMNSMEKDIKSTKDDITSIKVVLENEIRVNIQRVAEGHLDLSRNLHEAMKPNSKVEMLAIKVRMLETDVKELKQKIS